MAVPLAHLVVLALATYRTTVLFVVDWVPFSGLRDRIWARWPAGDDISRPHPFGYLWTCVSCMSVWHAAGWYGAYRCWGAATLSVAALFALSAGARALFAGTEKDED